MASSNDPNEEQTPQPPCSVTLRVSSPTCSISGNPPFSTITTYTCTTSRPIWILICLFNDFADRVHLFDPNNPDRSGHARRRGCYPTMQDEWDDAKVEFENTELLRMEPGQMFETSYTLYVKRLTVRRSETDFMVPGDNYWAGLGKRKCWWMYADEMDDGLSEMEMRDALRKARSVEWKPDVRARFTAVE